MQWTSTITESAALWEIVRFDFLNVSFSDDKETNNAWVWIYLRMCKNVVRWRQHRLPLLTTPCTHLTPSSTQRIFQLHQISDWKNTHMRINRFSFIRSIYDNCNQNLLDKFFWYFFAIFEVHLTTTYFMDLEK